MKLQRRKRTPNKLKLNKMEKTHIYEAGGVLRGRMRMEKKTRL
jgi:hypothetical protein